MNLEFNETANQERLAEAFKETLNTIGNGLKQGIDTFPIYLPKDIAGDVRSMLDEEFKRQGKSNNFDWCVVRREPNQYTGKMQSFTGETLGDQKYYKLKYYNN